MSRAGWCSPAFGTCESKSAHRVCQMRQDDGHLERCDCDSFNGHTHTGGDDQ